MTSRIGGVSVEVPVRKYVWHTFSFEVSVFEPFINSFHQVIQTSNDLCAHCEQET